MAFSTIGWSTMCGTMASERCGSVAIRTRSRSWNRTSSIDRYSRRNSSSRHSGTSCMCTSSTTSRSRSLNRASMASASRRSPLLDEHHDGAQRVEQEVRLQLHLQRAQLRGRQLPRQLRAAHLQLERFALARQGPLAGPQQRLNRHDGPGPGSRRRGRCRRAAPARALARTRRAAGTRRAPPAPAPRRSTRQPTTAPTDRHGRPHGASAEGRRRRSASGAPPTGSRV